MTPLETLRQQIKTCKANGWTLITDPAAVEAALAELEQRTARRSYDQGFLDAQAESKRDG